MTTVREAIIPYLSNDGNILGSATRRLETPNEFIKEWKAMSHRCIEEKTPQEYINVPIVDGETDSILSKTLVSWAESGMMAGASELGLRADGLNSTYWYVALEKDNHVQSTEFGVHFGMHVLCLCVFLCLCGAIYRRYVVVFREFLS